MDGQPAKVTTDRRATDPLLEVTWSELSGQAGSGTHYELAGDSLDALRTARAATARCTARPLPSPTWLDNRAATEASYYYLARAINACSPPGNGTWGTDGLSVERPTCP